MSTKITEQSLIKDFLAFLHASPSHFHAVETSIALLTQAGFEKISEIEDWTTKLKAGGKYYFTRNQSSIIAFAVPPKHIVGSGFITLAAHTDSPVLKVKPNSATSKQGYIQLGVEPYGGGLWYSWFDRDLSLAGRVIVKKANSSSSSSYGEFESHLVRINDPILRISSLAIHLNREVNDKGFAPNKQNHLLPTLATAIRAQLEGDKKANASGTAMSSSHHPILLNLLAKELNVAVGDIADFELSLYDTVPACLGGICKEFINARGLDNLCMSFISLRALIDSLDDTENWKTDNKIRICALFDNEEVGSDTFQGAGSTLLQTTLQRLNSCKWGSKHLDHILPLEIAVRKSLLVSADMAHAVHPNYAEAHEENHRPSLHGGLVVKENANQRYATSTLTAFALQQIAEHHNIPIQKFVVRNDSACGSTIGPILATNTGIRTVDVGVPQLSMHSIREVCGIGDVYNAHRLLTAVLREFSVVDACLKVDGM